MAIQEDDKFAGADGEKVPEVNPVMAQEDHQEGEVFEKTKRGLKSRHAQMIALGGTIGTGLFVSSGQTLSRGGPAFILGAFCLMSFAVFAVLTALTEVTAWLPLPGSSVNFFAHRYVSHSFGFATGWLYVYSLGILVPYEITAAGLVIDYWKNPVNIGVWITIMIVVIVGLNALPVRFYGETEFWFASTKVIMMAGLLMVSVILFFGGGPSHDRLGFRYWKNSGAANEYMTTGDTGRFVALLATLVLSAFPFTFAPELIVVTAGEMASPRKNLPIAARRYIYRIFFFYIASVLAIGVICPSNDAALTSGGTGAGASAFVVGIKNAGIPVLDSIINAGIIISAWSSGNSFLYLATRSLYSLSLAGYAPRWFRACTKSGVPYRCVMVCSLFCLLSYLNVSNSSAVVFNWFVNLTNESAFISWTCCCILHIRFRKACEVQGVTELPYRSWMQPWGAWAGLAFFPFLGLLNGFDVFFPKNWSISSFFTAYVGIPLFFLFYVGHRVYTWGEPWLHDPALVDLYTGMDETIEETEPPRGKKKWYRFITAIWE